MADSLLDVTRGPRIYILLLVEATVKIGKEKIALGASYTHLSLRRERLLSAISPATALLSFSLCYTGKSFYSCGRDHSP